MARPTKQGVSYFPLDVDFDSNIELFIAETGASGFGVLVAVWQLSYKENGYYIEYSDDLFLMIRRRLLTDVIEAKRIIDIAIKREIFDNRIFSDHKILTSKGIQKRYFIASKKKKLISVNKNYLCVDVSDVGNILYNHINDDGNNTETDNSDSNSCGNTTKEKEEVEGEVKVNGNGNEKGDVEEKGEGKELKPLVEQKPARPLELMKNVHEIFEYWQTELNHPKSKLDDKRKKKITQVLKLGYSLTDCFHVILGCKLSPYHQGDNKDGTVYDSIDLIFRDAGHVDQFIKIYNNPPKPKSNAQKITSSNVQAAQEASEIIKKREVDCASESS